MSEEEKQETPQEEKPVEPTDASDTAESSNDDAVGDADLHPQDEKVENKPTEGSKSAETTDKPAEGKEDSVEELTTIHERTIAAMSYISFLAIIPFYFKKESKFCRFHGKQGLLIAIIFFLMKPLMVLDIVFDLVLLLEIIVFAWMGVGALGGKWKKMPWFYEKACQFEDQLSLKTKGEKSQETNKF